MIVRKPLTPEQKERLAAREKPSQEEINQATDTLLMYLIEKVDSLDKPVRLKRGRGN